MYFSFTFIFIFGLVVGSFVNALVYRTENNISQKGRSFCPKCKNKIVWYDNIPMLSWLLLRGKCRQCKKSISIQYPFVELITGLSFLVISQGFGLVKNFTDFKALDIVQLLLLFFISFVLIFNAAYDYKTSYLLSKYLYLGIFATFIFLMIKYSFSLNYLDYAYNLASAALPALFFFLLSYFSKGTWMGEGDWELVFLMGLLLGFPNILVALYFAFIVGSIYGLAGILNKRFKMKTAVPFGPFLVAGTYFALIFGEKIFSLYVRIFLGG